MGCKQRGEKEDENVRGREAQRKERARARD